MSLWVNVIHKEMTGCFMSVYQVNPKVIEYTHLHNVHTQFRIAVNYSDMPDGTF